MAVFPFRVHFAGLCTFIENQRPKPRPVGMCIVLPNAIRHNAQIKIQMGTMRRVSTGTDVPEVPLTRHRVDFRLSGGDVGRGFDFNERAGSIQAAVGLSQIVPRIAQSNQDIVDDRRVASEVRAQVLLRDGVLQPDSLVVWTWRLNQNPFKPGSEVVEVAYQTLWSLYVERAAIRVTHIDQGGTETYELTPGREGILLAISNDCVAKDAPAIDHDFEHHYDLLHPASRATRNALSPQDKLRTLPERIATLAEVQEQLEKRLRGKDKALLDDELERLRVKAKSSGSTGCNCLGCIGQQLVISDFPAVADGSTG